MACVSQDSPFYVVPIDNNKQMKITHRQTNTKLQVDCANYSKRVYSQGHSCRAAPVQNMRFIFEKFTFSSAAAVSRFSFIVWK